MNTHAMNGENPMKSFADGMEAYHARIGKLEHYDENSTHTEKNVWRGQGPPPNGIWISADGL